MRAAIVIILSGVLLFLAGWFFLIKPGQDQSSVLAASPAETSQPDLAQNSGSSSPAESLTEGAPADQINAPEMAVEERKMPQEFNLEARVRSGEKVVVDVYEGQLGEYIFTTLTPTFNPPDGVNPVLIDLKVDSFRFFVDGEMNNISNSSIRFLPGQRGEYVAPVYSGEVAPGQTTAQGEEYIFDMSVSHPEGDSIILKAKGSSRPAEVQVNSNNPSSSSQETVEP